VKKGELDSLLLLLAVLVVDYRKEVKKEELDSLLLLLVVVVVVAVAVAVAVRKKELAPLQLLPLQLTLQFL